MGNPAREDITKQLTFGVQHLDGRTERKTIHPIPDGEIEGYSLIGRGTVELAVFPDHAIHQAFTHAPNFFNRVVGYRLVSGLDTEIFSEAVGKPYRSIEFYERASFGENEPSDFN